MVLAAQVAGSRRPLGLEATARRQPGAARALWVPRGTPNHANRVMTPHPADSQAFKRPRPQTEPTKKHSRPPVKQARSFAHSGGSKMFDTVLVGIDGEEGGRDALALATWPSYWSPKAEG